MSWIIQYPNLITAERLMAYLMAFSDSLMATTTLLPRLRGCALKRVNLRFYDILENKIVKKGRMRPFLALLFRYKTDIFQNKKKPHIVLKKKK